MKKIKPIIMLLSIIFSMGIKAQDVTDVTTSVLLHNSISIDHSDNGKYIVIAVDGYSGNGYAEVYYNNYSGHDFGEVITNYTLAKGSEETDVKVFQNSAIVTDYQNVYFYYRSDVIDGTPRYTLQKNGEKLMHFDNNKLYKLKAFNGYLYLFTGDGNGGYFLRKIVESTHALLFTTPITHGDITDILLMPNGNIAGEDSNGDLFEFSASNGNEIKKIHDHTGRNPIKYRYSDTGFLEYQGADNVWHIENYQTDFEAPSWNLFGESYKSSIKLSNGEYYFTSGSWYFCLNDEAVHGEKKYLNGSYGVTLSSWANQDGSFTFVTKKTESENMHLIKLLPDFQINSIDCVNPGGMNIVDIKNGKTYKNGNWVNGYNENTIVYANTSDIPAVGSTPDTSLMGSPPSGMSLLGLTHVRNLNRNGQNQLIFDAIYRSPEGVPKHVIFVRVHLLSQEEVSIKNNTLADFKVCPNPATKFIKLTAEKEISQLEIFDLSGRSIMKLKKIKDKSVFVGNLDKGTYLVKAISNGKIGIKKLIIN